MEAQLREAQCYEALSGLRQQLRQRSYAGHVKTRNGSGQAYWLRSNAFMDQVNRRIKVHQLTYTAGREAYFSLNGPG